MKSFIVEFVWRTFARVGVKFFRWLDLNHRVAELVPSDIEVKKLIVDPNAVKPMTDSMNICADESAAQPFQDNCRSGSTMAGARHIALQAVQSCIWRKALCKPRAKLQQLCP